MRRLVAALLLIWTATGFAAAPTAAKIDWQPWSDGVFERAAREKRFVLLDLEAVWCHWCHVMDEVTYSDPKVVALIKSKYIPVRVDQDSRPDISRRYENYGWPATVVFNAEGGEIVKRRGYLAPQVMISMLEEIIVDPSPVKYGDEEPIAKFADNPLLSPKLMPLELLKVTEARLALVLLAEKLILPDGAFAPDMVMLWPFWLSVMLLPPASTMLPVDMSAPAPAVLPDIVALILPPFKGGI